MNRCRSSAAVVAALVLLCARVAPANTVFYDDFNRGNGTAPSSYLNGSTPTSYNATLYPSGLTWVSTAGSSHNLTTTANGGQEVGGWNAKLPVTLEASRYYTLTMTVGPTLQNALQVGFGQKSGGMSDYNYLSQDVANMTWARIGQINDFGKSVSSVATVSGTYVLSGSSGPGFVNTLVLGVDTSNGLSNAALSWEVNGVVKGTWTSNLTGYNSFLFGRGDGPNDPNSTQISDVTLTAIVPEPSAVVLLGAGVAGTAVAFRRRRVRRRGD